MPGLRGRTSVETRLIEDSSAFALLEPFWNRIVVQSAANTCHSTFEWLFTWWQHFGTDRRLLLLVVYEHDIPVGLAPLYAGNGTTEPRDLHFLGQGLSDYADFIIPLDRPDVTEALVLSLIHISEPTRLGMISYAVFCLKKKNYHHTPQARP